MKLIPNDAKASRSKPVTGALAGDRRALPGGVSWRKMEGLRWLLRARQQPAHAAAGVT